MGLPQAHTHHWGWLHFNSPLVAGPSIFTSSGPKVIIGASFIIINSSRKLVSSYAQTHHWGLLLSLRKHLELGFPFLITLGKHSDLGSPFLIALGPKSPWDLHFYCKAEFKTELLSMECRPRKRRLEDDVTGVPITINMHFQLLARAAMC